MSLKTYSSYTSAELVKGLARSSFCIVKLGVHFMFGIALNDLAKNGIGQFSSGAMIMI